jgi:large subunit ribosomal protein L10
MENMNRTEKATEVESLREQIAKSQITIVADYKGLTVAAVNDLRRQLFGRSSRFKVVKNRLAKIAIKGSPAEVLTVHLKGTAAIATSDTDAAGASKVLSEFAKTNELLKIKAGFLDGKLLSAKDIQTLANLPSKEELISKLMSSMQAPMSNLVSVLAQIPRQVVNVLSAVRDQKEKTA